VCLLLVTDFLRSRRTPEYLAPEIVLGRGHDHCVDWWAFGVLVYECLAGYSPFADAGGADQVVICKNIIHGHVVFPRRNFPKVTQDLCKHLLHRNPASRLGVNQASNPVTAHRWFADVDFDALRRRQLPAPWKPKIKSDYDTSNFEQYDIDDSYDKSYKDNPKLWKDFGPSC